MPSHEWSRLLEYTEQRIAIRVLQCPLFGMCGRVHTHRPVCGHDPPRHHNVRSAPDPAAAVIITTGRRTAAMCGLLPWQTR